MSTAATASSTPLPSMAHGALPRSATRFVGREPEISEITERVTDPACRLLTLVGPGGIGKTRLAIESARRLQESSGNGVVFVPLQPVRGGELIESAVATALGIPFSGPAPLKEQLLAAVAGRNTVLVLDNFEHLVERADFIADLIDAAPGVTCLVTSREVLNVAHEWVYVVDGLPVPQSGADGAASVDLFIDRAQRMRHGFNPASESQPITDICRLVGGMPLAIELAASWTKAMPCADIADELRRNTTVLSSTLRDIPEQHRSMAAVFDHSWSLLREEERAAFMRLSVFQGGFPRAAAEAVAGAPLPMLIGLVDKSLLRARPDGRFDMHELLRQYAEARLDTSGQAVATRDAHSDWYMRFAGERATALEGGDHVTACREIRTEIDNVRAAWHWAALRRRSTHEAAPIDALSNFYQMSTADMEGCRLFATMIAAFEPGPVGGVREARVLAAAYLAKGYLCLRLGSIDEGEEDFQRSLDLIEQFELGFRRGKATDPRIGLGINALVRADLERAEAMGDAVLETAERDEHLWNHHYALYILMRVAAIRGEIELARERALRAYALTLESGDRWFGSMLMSELGTIAATLGDYAEARRYHEVSMEERAQANDRRGVAWSMQRLGMVALAEGDPAEATRRLRWALAVQQETGDAGAAAEALHGLGLAEIAGGDHAEAARSLREALVITHERHFTARTLAVIGAAGELMAACGRADRGVSLLALAASHPAGEDETIQRAEYVLGHLEQRLGPARMTSALREGRGADLQEAVASLLGELAGLERNAVPEPQDGPPVVELTPREQEVLALLSRGLPNRQIAAGLGVSEGTVKAHTAKLYNKLGVDNRVQAVARARELGLSVRR